MIAPGGELSVHAAVSLFVVLSVWASAARAKLPGLDERAAKALDMCRQIALQRRLVQPVGLADRDDLDPFVRRFVAHRAIFSTWAQAASAIGRARLPSSAACSLAAVPSSARPMMPCRIAARRNML